MQLHCLEEQGGIENCKFSKALEDERVKEIKEIINAQKEFIDKIHEYGLSKGKYVLVGSWGVLGKVEAPQQGVLIKDLVSNYDFVVTTISSEEIYNRSIDTHRWKTLLKSIGKFLEISQCLFGLILVLQFSNAYLFSVYKQNRASKVFRKSRQIFCQPKQKGKLDNYFCLSSLWSNDGTLEGR